MYDDAAEFQEKGFFQLKSRVSRAAIGKAIEQAVLNRENSGLRRNSLVYSCSREIAPAFYRSKRVGSHTYQIEAYTTDWPQVLEVFGLKDGALKRAFCAYYDDEAICLGAKSPWYTLGPSYADELTREMNIYWGMVRFEDAFAFMNIEGAYYSKK